MFVVFRPDPNLFRAERVENPRTIIGEPPDVMLYAGDCNEVLLGKVFSRARHQDYRRARVKVLSLEPLLAQPV